MDQLTVRDLVSRDFVGVSESDSVQGAIELMREEGETGAVVLHGSEPVGTLSPGDVLDCIVEGDDLQDTPVSEIMHPEPPTISADSTVTAAADLLSRIDGELVLVENDGEFLGVISVRELATLSRGTIEWDENADLLGGGMDRSTEAVDTEYSNQSICEACGALSRDLVNVNGQLLCPDCRSV